MDVLNNIEKKKLYSLFQNIERPAVTTERTQDSDVLIVDGL